MFYMNLISLKNCGFARVYYKYAGLHLLLFTYILIDAMSVFVFVSLQRTESVNQTAKA